jgi:predicted nucleic acid-binding Zn ribbon protein
MSHRRSPRQLALVLEPRREEWAPPTLLGEIQRRWADAVGEAIAAQSLPVSERSGVLTVSCSGAVWAQELDLMSDSILRRLNALLAGGAVRRLRCVCTPPRARS